MKAAQFLAIDRAILLLLLTLFSAQASTSISSLRCEYLENPLGIDTVRPRLSWMVESTERGQKELAYQIFVSSSEKDVEAGQGDLWDSGKIESDQTVGIAYGGVQLTSRQECFWKVRVWDRDGKVLQSQVAHWEMGLLSPEDWKAVWIARTNYTGVTPAPLFRRTFELEHKIKRARLYVSGLGYCEPYINGQRVGDHLLDPAYTRYDRRVLYVTYDVVPLLKRGKNVLAAMLGNGWFNVQNRAAWDFDKAPWRAAPRMLAQLEIEFSDGQTAVIATDNNWKCSDSPIVYNTIYSGEIYDARLAQSGWDTADFDDSKWSHALPVEAPKGRLSAQMLPPIRLDHLLKPVAIHEAASNVFVFDFGQSLAGNTRLKVKGPAGTRVTLKYSELLSKGGRADQSNIDVHVRRFDSTQRFQTDTYVLNGSGQENWHSRFNYNGFRYVEVTGLPEKPSSDTLIAAFFHTDVPVAGHFECSNPLLNRIWNATRWSYLDNLQGIPTDCPHREKNGWTGDAQLAAEQGMFNFFPPAVYTKWINDLGDEQRADGRLPGIVPTSGWGYQWGNGPAWDSVFLLISYYQYVYYGDSELFRRHYQGMKRYVDYLTGRAQDGIVNIGLSDWVPWKTKTKAGITDTAYYYVDAKIVSLAAQLMDNNEDARKYSELAASIREKFNNRFYRPDSGSYDNGGQTALSCALYQGLVEPQNQERVLSNLVAAVAKTEGHIDTGILGAKYLLNALLENGRADVAYRIVAQRDQPGWGWWIEEGATTLWEAWNGEGSQIHIMFGDVSAWFYKALAGINPDPAAPGFKHFFIKPQVVGDLTFARGEYDSIRGKIVSDWKLVGNQFQAVVTIPANTTATVWLPVAQSGSLLEGGKPATQARGVVSVKEDSRKTVLELESGTYEFAGPLAR